MIRLAIQLELAIAEKTHRQNREAHGYDVILIERLTKDDQSDAHRCGQNRQGGVYRVTVGADPAIHQVKADESDEKTNPADDDGKGIVRQISDFFISGGK